MPTVLKVLVLKVLIVLGVLGLLVLGLLVLPVTRVAAQARAGMISGIVVDGVSGKPVATAVVTIVGPSLVDARRSPPPKILTGADGRFTFGNLEPGVYGVMASKGGYADGEPGRRRPGGQAPAITLTASDPSAAVTVPMWRYSAIAGTVVDDGGEAVAGMQVRALWRPPGAKTFAGLKSTFTDDRGMYRLTQLVPGSYVVVVSPPPNVAAATPPRGSRVQLYPLMFYPSVPAPVAASAIDLAAADERSGVDIQITPAPAARVSGLLIGAAGLGAAKTTIRLAPAGMENVASDAVALTTVTDSEGRFAFHGVVAGQYALRASADNSDAKGYVDLALTVTGHDVDDLVATMRLPLRITAHSRYEGNAPAPGRSPGAFVATPFMLERVDGTFSLLSSSMSGIGSGDTLSLYGFVPGRYRLVVPNPPSGWMLKAALLDGVDVSDTPFDFTKDISDLTLVFTDRVSGVSGRVDGTDAASAEVLLFRTDAPSWSTSASNDPRFRSVRVSATGEFRIAAVPAGDYFVIAVKDDDAADWRDLTTLESLARGATHVSIVEGEMKALTLRVQDIR